MYKGSKKQPVQIGIGQKVLGEISFKKMKMAEYQICLNILQGDYIRGREFSVKIIISAKKKANKQAK